MNKKPDVDFYVLSGRRDGERLRFACRLTEKIWKMGHRIFVHSPDPSAANVMDNLLWTFKDDSFVPHCVDTGERAPLEPIIIGRGQAPAADCEVLVNLAEDVPDWAMNFMRIAELIPPDDIGKAHGRERFRHYRSQGCEVRTHAI